MNLLEQVLAYGFGQRALLAALMIGLLNGYVGGYVVMRRAALFAGGLSHTLFPGIAIGALIAGLNPLSALIGATIMAMATGLLATGIASTSRIDREAALAILFTAAFGAGLLILQHLPLYVNIDNYLFGNILAVSDFDLWFVFIAGGVTLSLLILLQRPMLLFVFSEEIAAAQRVPVRCMGLLLAALLVLTMIVSLQAVGTILALGLLVAPAATIYLFSNTPRTILWGAALLGAVAAVISVFISHAANIQTGPCAVITLGGIFLAGYILSPRYGLMALLAKRFHIKAEHHTAEQEPDHAA
jgi:ABC-type Mn2+/Zn2+ transport system permease subunit